MKTRKRREVEIDICLKDVMDTKHMTRSALARASNTDFKVIDKWYRGELEKMDLDILARICYILECSPKDILKYRRP